MKRFFVNVICCCVALSALSADPPAPKSTCLAGKLVKRHYPAPPIVKNAAFGWYLELNKNSQETIQYQFQLCSKEDQRIFKELNIDLEAVQCVLCDDEFLLHARSLEGKFITIEGKLESPCFSRKNLHFSIEPDAIISAIPSTSHKNLSLDQFDYLYQRLSIASDSSDETSLQLPEGVSEKLTTLKGKLILRLFPGPPEYISIERGDRADYCWMLQMDQESFKIATTTPVPEPSNDLKSIMSWSNHDELYLSLGQDMIDFCCRHESKEITVQGYLFHAHTAHHYAPILIDVKKIF